MSQVATWVATLSAFCEVWASSLSWKNHSFFKGEEMQQQDCSLCGQERETDKLVFLTISSSQRACFCHQCIASNLQIIKNGSVTTETTEGPCSLWGRSAKEVDRMLPGKKGSICSECVMSLNFMLSDFLSGS